MKKLSLMNFIPLLMAVPAVIIGVIAMYTNKVPFAILGQNIFYMLICGMISFFILIKTKVKKDESTKINTIIVAVILLILTFVSSGIEGVHSILISTIFGNFPVPLMGYGISPIIGYFISVTWLAKSKINL